MRKIVRILLLGILFGGCSVFKNNGKTVPDLPASISGNIFESTEYQNITNSGFFIQKAEIETISSAGNDKFTANIKFEKPDKYLISVRSRTGIEGARIYISGDSIKMNDRINRKLYYGTSVYLQRKYGLSQSFLPLIFGDMLLDKKCRTSAVKCIEDKFTIDCQLNGVPLSYSIDCKKRKVLTVNQIRGINKEGLNIIFANYFNAGNGLIPRKIEFDDNVYGITVKIKILKVQSPWSGNISFVPGKGYELIELL